MQLVIYLLLVLGLLTISFSDIRLGTINVKPFLTKFFILAASIFTLYLYYASVNAIDAANYQASFGYLGSVPFSTDVLYYRLAIIVKNIWGDYQVLRLIIGAIYLIPIFTFLKTRRDTVNAPLLFLLYFIFPFFQNIVALKNTIAATVVVFAFYAYFRIERRIISIPLTYILLFVASLFHDTAIVYILLFSLMLILKRIADLRKNYYLLFGVALILILIIRSGIATSFLNRLVGDSNLMYISRLGTIGYGFLIISVMQLVVFYLVQRTIRETELIRGSSNVFYNEISLLFYATLILIPLYSINVLFFRLFRNIAIFGYLVCAETNQLSVGNRNRSKLMILMLIVLMLYDANGIGSLESILLNLS